MPVLKPLLRARVNIPHIRTRVSGHAACGQCACRIDSDFPSRLNCLPFVQLNIVFGHVLAAAWAN
jgi:hypothetical protein